MLFYSPSVAPTVFVSPSSFSSHAHATPLNRSCSQQCSDVQISRERYNRALAEMRAAEAEYAANIARAKEEARKQEEAAMRQRAIREEMQRLRVLQAQEERTKKQRAIEVEIQRRQRAELLRSQLFCDTTVDAEPEEPQLIFVPQRQIPRSPIRRAPKPAPQAQHESVVQDNVLTLDDIIQLIQGIAPAQHVAWKPDAPVQVHPTFLCPLIPCSDVLYQSLREPSPIGSPESIPQSAALEKNKVDVKGKGKARAVSPAPEGPLKERLKRRLDQNVESEIEEVIKGLISSLFGGQGSSATASTSTSNETSSSKVSYDTSIRDPTLFSTLFLKVQQEPPKKANLYRSPALAGEAAARVRASFSAHRASSSPSSPTTPSPPQPIPSPTESTSRSSTPSSTSSLDIGLSTIETIESTFLALKADFSFPSTLDFHPSEDTLAYTTTNAPVRLYEHALNEILAKLDAVESDGDEELRGRRRSVVKAVESALEEVDKLIGEKRASLKATSAPIEASSQVAEEKALSDVLADDAGSEQPSSIVVQSVKADAIPVDTPATTISLRSDAVVQTADVPMDGPSETIDIAPSPEVVLAEQVLEIAFEAGNSIDPAEEHEVSEATANDEPISAPASVPTSETEVEPTELEDQGSSPRTQLEELVPLPISSDPNDSAPHLQTPVEALHTSPAPLEGVSTDHSETSISADIVEKEASPFESALDLIEATHPTLEGSSEQVVDPSPTRDEPEPADSIVEAAVPIEHIPESEPQDHPASTAVSPVPSFTGTEFLASLSHDQFSFPPRRDPDSEEHEEEDAVLVDHESARSVSERDEWSEVEA
ncbi:hypothetical protein EW146_g5949 [Bondarzewia mesenterica]|uniref:BAG domain-containing protein n=1 Tax=Bondarzewia mesenterica TaxID=1095465 RepID=A0A4S4LS08_9AGAM|nr:hypothetical protein EW146_g5949 [Bondarzewia mesenterica]